MVSAENNSFHYCEHMDISVYIELKINDLFGIKNL